MKVYITKHALSKGIIEYNEDNNFSFEINKPNSLCIMKKNPFSDGNFSWIPVLYFKKTDWHLTKKEATEKAEQMRIQEINKLLRKVKKLQNLKFK
jgi:hypothetical protein